MNDLTTKCIGHTRVEVKDAEAGLVEAVVARVGIVDMDGDIFLPGAYGTRDVRVSEFNHRSWPQRGGDRPIGRGTIQERGDEVVASMKFFMKTTAGREAFEVVKELAEQGEWSYGWLPGSEREAEVTPEMKKLGARRAIKSVPVVEVSPVLMGASVGTRTIGVKECQSCGHAVKVSQNDLRSELERALSDTEEPGPDGHLWVVDVVDDTVIYEMRSKSGEEMLLRRSFTVSDADGVELGGERTEVRRLTEYVPVEDGERGVGCGETKATIDREIAKFRATVEANS